MIGWRREFRSVLVEIDKKWVVISVKEVCWFNFVKKIIDSEFPVKINILWDLLCVIKVGVNKKIADNFR